MGEVRYYYIRPTHDPEKYLNIRDAKLWVHAELIQWTHAVQAHGQFLFIPTGIDHEYYIALRHSGQLCGALIRDGNGVAQAPIITDPGRIHLQKWRLTNLGANTYAIHAQRSGNDRAVWDVVWSSDLNGMPVILYDWHGGKNQMFAMPEADVIRIADLRGGTGRPFEIPSPPPPGEGPTPETTPPVLIGEIYVPYFLVREQISPWNELATQVNRSPYYLLSRHQFWRIDHEAVHESTDGTECKTTRRVGMSKEVSRSFEHTMHLSMSAGGQLVIKALTAIIKTGLELTLKSTTTETYRDYDETTREQTYRFKPGKLRHAIWQLIDRYELRRGDGSVVSYWEDRPAPYFHSATYPPAVAISSSASPALFAEHSGD